jgi:hypothetical protein
MQNLRETVTLGHCSEDSKNLKQFYSQMHSKTSLRTVFVFCLSLLHVIQNLPLLCSFMSVVFYSEDVTTF